jgi:hypothetical protein
MIFKGCFAVWLAGFAESTIPSENQKITGLSRQIAQADAATAVISLYPPVIERPRRKQNDFPD